MPNVHYVLAICNSGVQEGYKRGTRGVPLHDYKIANLLLYFAAILRTILIRVEL